jgi:hypothetical protein
MIRFDTNISLLVQALSARNKVRQICSTTESLVRESLSATNRHSSSQSELLWATVGSKEIPHCLQRAAKYLTLFHSCGTPPQSGVGLMLWI